MRWLWNALGLLSVAVGVVGAFLPLLPTVPFMLLAAWFFAKGNPAWEARLLAHPHFGPPNARWRERGAIGRRAKTFAVVSLAGSAVIGLLLLPGHWKWIPLGVAVLSGTFILTRPSE